jgi:type II secretory pathway pseudopilin PulG
MAVTALERRLNTEGLDESEMASLGKMFAEAAKTNQMASAFIGDRAGFLPVFQMGPDEIAHLADADGEQSSKQADKSFAGFQYYFGRFAGVFDLDENFYLQVMATNISLALMSPKSIPKINALAEITSQKLENSRFRFTLSKLLLPPFQSAVIKEANSLAQVRLAQTALAIERFRLAHGQLPDKLDELVPQFLAAVPDDPFDGQPLRYHHLVKGYVIYSVGSDGEDNGGRERPVNVKSTDKTHYDITFTVER